MPRLICWFVYTDETVAVEQPAWLAKVWMVIFFGWELGMAGDEKSEQKRVVEYISKTI